MKFLVDAQLPPGLAAWIRNKGHSAFALREIGLRDADDTTIWNWASTEPTVIVSKDEDFPLLAANNPGPQVMWIRSGNLVKRFLFVSLETAWEDAAAQLESGVRVVEVR